MEALPIERTPIPVKRNKRRFWQVFKSQRYLYMMSIPFVIWLFVFSYIPVWGWIMAFQNYRPGRPIFQQKWVGLDNFIMLFSDEQFYQVLRNTLAMSVMGLIVGFTVPVIFAVMLNELRQQIFKRSIQTISYLPHFVSWVVVAGLVTKMLSIDGGVVNMLLMKLNLIQQPIQFMAKGKLFWFIVTAADMWKETGWNAIIFLAAMAGIDPEQYEAATVDGAGRFRRIWHITLPGIRPTYVIVLILAIGSLISIGFERQFLLGNPLVSSYSEVLELYALNYGLKLNRFSFGTAIGVVNSFVAIMLVLAANGIFKKVTKQSVF